MTGEPKPAGRDGAELRREPAARVFFALWPEPGLQAALARYGRVLLRELGGKPTREDSVHMTLLFLGDVDESRLPALQAAAAAVHFAPHSLRIDTTQCWRHNKIAWVGPRETPAPLAELVARLEAQVGQAGFAFDRRPFAAHVTLLRKAHCRPLDMPMPAVDWRVEDFVLVRSQLDAPQHGAGGSRYSVIGRWAASQGGTDD
jgi:2'-5' RNA ligase